METRLKGVVVTAVLAGGDGVPRATLYEGDQAFVLALAAYYGLTDVEALANDLAALLVQRKTVEMGILRQSEALWAEWEKQGGLGNGNKTNLQN